MAGSSRSAMQSFFGVGAYTVTLALVYWDLTPWLGIPLGMLVGAVAAVLIGTADIPPARALFRAGDAGLSAGDPLRAWNTWASRKCRCRCIASIRWCISQFTDPAFYTVVAVGLLVVGMLVCMLVENSRFGLALAGDPAERACRRGRRHRCPTLEDARAGRVRHDRRRRPAGSMPACCWWSRRIPCSACWSPRRRWW